MVRRVRMDWVLFWTILVLVCFGLVMVYSASSVVQELRHNPVQRWDMMTTDELLAAGAASPVGSSRNGWPSTRSLVALALGIGLVAVTGIAWWQRRIPLSWALAGLVAAAFLQVLAYWMEADRTPHYAFLVRQAGAAIIGFFLMMVLSQRDYRRLCSAQWAFAGLAAVLFLLLVALFFGEQRRWLNLGISVQPSEFAKPVLIVFLAWFVAQRSSHINRPRTVWSAALALAALAGAVVVPDLGTAMVLVATAAAVFYLAGLNRKYTAVAVAAAAVLMTGAILHKPYRLKRVIEFFDPGYKILVYVDPEKKLLQHAEINSRIRDTRYHGTQAKLAIGAGGTGGRGLMHSRQKLLFLPHAHNDYIFAIVGEELGLWGATLVLGAFVVILWRGYRLYLTAPDDFGKYLAVGVTTTILFQAFLNMSVVLDLGPSKGIPLPLVSFGGSSMLSTMICLGLLLSVSQRSTTA